MRPAPMSAADHFEMREMRRRLRAPLVIAILVLLIAVNGLWSRDDDPAGPGRTDLRRPGGRAPGGDA